MINLQMLGIWLLIGMGISVIFSLVRKEDFNEFLIRLIFVEFINVIFFLTFHG